MIILITVSLFSFLIKEMFCSVIENRYRCKISSLKIIKHKGFSVLEGSACAYSAKQDIKDIDDIFSLGHDIFIGSGEGGGSTRFFKLTDIKVTRKNHCLPFCFATRLDQAIDYNNFFIRMESRFFCFRLVHYFKIFQVPRVYLGFWEFPSYKEENNSLLKIIQHDE
jgi:hypothetical protein